MTDAALSSLVQQLQLTLQQFPQTKRWYVAFSGGLDSSVLLHLSAQVLQKEQLSAVHINHQLQTHSDDWALHCSNFCQQLGIPLFTEKVTVCAEGEGIEGAARQARYEVFANLLGPNDGLLMAHHQDDQAETFLLRLARGSGVKGLASIPQQRMLGKGRLIRPLLNNSRAELEAYAQQYQLSWINDPSNRSIAFDRNYIRQEIMPLLANRWPEFTQQVARSAALCGQSQKLNEELAEIDLRSCATTTIAGQGLMLDRLSVLSESRQVNVFRYWLSESVNFLPNEKLISAWLTQFYSAAQDAQPHIVWESVGLRRFQQVVYKASEGSPATGRFLLNLNDRVETPWGYLKVLPKVGCGVRYRADQRLSITFDIKTVSSRFYLAGRTGSRSLKKIYQEFNVPYWLRSQLPILLIDEQPAAFLGFEGGPAVLEGFQVAADETAIYPIWQSMSLKKCT